MLDREKVINGLHEMSCRATWNDIDRIRNKFQPIINGAIDLLKEQDVVAPLTIDDAVSELMDKHYKLLKEQKAVEPEVDVLNETDRLYRCPKCHKHFFYRKQKYCDQCGQEIKWNA